MDDAIILATFPATFLATFLAIFLATFLATFHITNNYRFKKGLVNAAKSTDAWIVTGGTNDVCVCNLYCNFWKIVQFYLL